MLCMGMILLGVLLWSLYALMVITECEKCFNVHVVLRNSECDGGMYLFSGGGCRDRMDDGVVMCMW